MTWEGLPICLACHRRLYGPGTGPVGPIPSLAILWNAPMCELCGVHASPAAVSRLWRDEEPLPDEAAP